MAQTVDLFGGPMHGKRITLPTGQNHFHIKGLVTAPVEQKLDGTVPPRPTDIVKTREGMYSRVRNTINFEWDGWINHG